MASPPTRYLKNRFPDGHQVVVFLGDALQLGVDTETA